MCINTQYVSETQVELWVNPWLPASFLQVM
jgi:hypothetical protein